MPSKWFSDMMSLTVVMIIVTVPFSDREHFLLGLWPPMEHAGKQRRHFKPQLLLRTRVKKRSDSRQRTVFYIEECKNETSYL